MNNRQYKKKYFICKDSFGKKLYYGDTVEIFNPNDSNFYYYGKPKIGIIYNNIIDGAWVRVETKKISDYILRPLLSNEEEEYLLYTHNCPNEGHMLFDKVIRKPYVKKL